MVQWRVLGLCAVVGLGPGCVQRRVVRDGWATLRALGDTPPAAGASKPAKAANPHKDHWAILIHSFEGPRAFQQARQHADRLRRQAYLPDVWVDRSDGDHAHVYRGLYDNPTDPWAQDDLRQTRMVSLDGRQALATARLVSLNGTSHDPPQPLDLRQHMGMYSLQIGYYDEAFGPKFREAAAEATEALRDQGDQAFYYHGPHRSMVTVGLFTDEDFTHEGYGRVYGPRIRALQEKYPYNLANGRTVVEKVNGQTAAEQPSFLVKIH